ncbi:glycoside hydrolase family 2 TIM barrel-domain containing protein [Pontibacter sp. G13]|uniref:glycoside hydrolase family 2 TIM barrel-domain containing protein n=1 Tax=Pontibacter sp. G13 TaxID=3074898 RepID=UPI00288B6CBD|nr:glycoside hydrolase family 2 TIM barrel-domain containing protein [Pontibacter sp. G13]WNJ19853.1 glycoside hydrolase family 2 TIM barrel-domain containing protein [Pontibacter sp. G13]
MRKTILLALTAWLLHPVWAQLPTGYPETPRQKTILGMGWEYTLDKGSNGSFWAMPPADAAWESVSVPHSLELSGEDKNGNEDDEYQLTFHRWVGWYKRSLDIQASEGQQVFLEFEGAHQVTTLWVNGRKVGTHNVGGYTPFHFDITDFVELGGTNEILLSVDNRRYTQIPPEGDRYDYIKWSGLYRDVYQVVTDPVHITFNWEGKDKGIFITTPTVSRADATIHVEAHVQNDAPEPQQVQVINRIIDDRGLVVLKLESEVEIAAGDGYLFSQTGGIDEQVRLWSPDDPYLYRVNTQVLVDGRVVDCVENRMGIRKVEFVDGKGMLLNGEPIELIGTNRHQAMWFIGDAVPNSMHWKDAYQMKEVGFNSVRLAHYPHDDAFIEACDELGIIVYEEPPTWIGIGDPTWFDNLEVATRRMIRNHRNHPSVVFWAAGINHRGPVERLHYTCKDEDPSRPTASNGAPWTAGRGSGVTDIYTPMDYQNTPIMPNEFTYLCEHGGSPDALRNQYEVSKSREIANMIGVAHWTGHDYMTFKSKMSRNNNRLWSNFRIPNTAYYWYKSELLDEPSVHIADPFASRNGKVIVFSNCDRVELYQDDQLVASQLPDRNDEMLYLDHPSFTFRHDWTAGKLEAKGYLNGQLTVEHTRWWAGEPQRLELVIETDDRPFYANGTDFKLAQAYILDSNGEVVMDATNEVKFTVSGEGEIIGDASIGANPAVPYKGVGTGYVRSTGRAGKIKVVASAKGLKSATAFITTVPYETNRTLAEAMPIYELKKEWVDLSSAGESVGTIGDGAFEFGVESQSEKSEFLQFGWNAMIGEDGQPATYSSQVFEGAKVTVEGPAIDWYANWGMVSNDPYLAIDGCRVAYGQEMKMTITGLPVGKYRLTTYHHNREEIRRAPESLQIEVSDASGTHIAEEGLAVSSGIKLYRKGPAHIGYYITSDGSDIEVVFSSNSERVGVPLNGFIIEEALETQGTVQ